MRRLSIFKVRCVSINAPWYKHIAFLLFEDVTVLDLVGPAQVLSRLGSVKLDLVASSMAPVATDAGFAFLPTATFDQAPPADLLCVPGGLGTLKVMQDAPAIDWVRRTGQSAQWVTSVCTGSLILATAGLLTGYRTACHWASRHQLAWFGATPPFDAGSPAKAGPARVGAYQDWVRARVGDRDEVVRAIAHRAMAAF